jgi:DNA-binding GntR family transcriptional regulator
MTIVTVTDQAYDYLKAKILSRELLPGMKLNEADLAEELGVSRTPLREAIARLTQEGLVTAHSRRGAYVTRLGRDEVLEILEVREALECMAARKAARRASREDIDALRAKLRRDGHLRNNASKQQLPTFDFHEQIVRLSRNGKLADLMDNIHNQLTILRHGSSFVAGRSADASHEHAQILDALESGDPDLAELRMRDHLTRAHKNMLDHVTF